MKSHNRQLILLLILIIALALPFAVLAQDPDATPEPGAALVVVATAAPVPAPDGSAPSGILVYILTFFSGALVGVTAVLSTVGRLKNDAAALNAIEWLGKSVPADVVLKLNLLGKSLQSAGDVVVKVTDGQPNDSPPAVTSTF
jgi:hypothetical protein